MSVTTTQKNTNFQSQPLGAVERLTDVPGVGPKSAEKLEEANILTPVQLMGQFMVAAFMAEIVSAAAALRVHHLSLLPLSRLLSSSRLPRCRVL